MKILIGWYISVDVCLLSPVVGIGCLADSSPFYFIRDGVLKTVSLVLNSEVKKRLTLFVPGQGAVRHDQIARETMKC